MALNAGERFRGLRTAVDENKMLPSCGIVNMVNTKTDIKIAHEHPLRL